MRELRLLGLQTDAFAFGASYEFESNQPIAFFEDRCALTDNSAFYGAFSADRLVGLMSLVRETSEKTKHHASIYAVYTHPDFRGQGVSSKLLRACIDHARSLIGVEYIQLGVATNNAPAIKVYEKAGFKTWGTMKSALRVDGIDIDEHMMALKLVH